MGRIARKRLGRGVYHVFNRAWERRQILATGADKQSFLDLLVRYAAAESLTVYHYSVMPNHYHLAVEAMEPAALSRWIGKVQRRYSLKHHQLHGGEGPLWQARFKSVLVDKEGYLGRLGRYIERNALRARIAGVNHPWDYAWCSASCYVLGAPDRLVAASAHPFWQSLGGSDESRREGFANFLRSGDEAREDELVFRDAAQVIGGRDFRSRVGWAAGRPTARRRGRPRKGGGELSC